MRNAILLLAFVALSAIVMAGPPHKEPHPIDAAKGTESVKNTDSKRWKKGFIVTLKGDTIEGKIKTMDFLDAYYDYQTMVSFKDQKGITQYSPNALSSFTFFEFPNNTVTMQAVSSPEGTGRVFLKLYYSGMCKVYGLTIKEVKAGASQETVDGQVQSSMISREKKYIQVQGSQFFPLKRVGFKKNMMEVFSSSPQIVAGLNSKEYTYEKWEALVRDYNAEHNK